MVELVEIRFLRTEIRTGLTTASIARNSKQRDRRERNVALARRAYDTALRFAVKIYLPGPVAEELRTDLESLKKQLEELGEKF